MLEEMVDHQSEQLPLIEEMSSPVIDDDEIFDQLCEAEFIQDTLQNSEVTSCHREEEEEEEEEKIATYCSLSDDVIYNTSTTNTATSSSVGGGGAVVKNEEKEGDSNNNNNNVDNISASIDFSSPCSYLMGGPTMFTDNQNMELIISLHSDHQQPSLTPPPQAHMFDHDLIPPPPNSYNNPLIPPPDIFILMNNDIQAQDQQLDYKTCLYSSHDSTLYNPPPPPPNAFCSDTQNLMSPHINASATPTEISNLDDSTYKVGKLSVEQRKEKIHRYMKKRNQRNFNKKIKYACRKTLADSRPRVRGRFAKNDDFGEALRSAVCSHHEEDEKDDVDVKDQDDDILDTSDIFAHISGVNSFQCNFPMIQSWI